ncbi:TnsD family Tn7-like transposition protein [Bacillus cytotoxicus]|uniref:TnsD family Tn7-like transposition protein n=1 Tax=Bacillus cereus group TaxID=86661 RepID=UPI001F56E33E|nr:TnsD family Tn7-like transposition protein [Bacillus cereus group sp. BfR-BA-01492]EMA6344107.1 TniQ family protein [Bacillus cytotoxicus]
MLAYFPYLYENELIYSVFARYYNHTGNPSKKLNIRRKELIPGKSWTISPHLPTSLNSLAKQLHIFLYPSVDDWIKRNTMYYYYTNFFSKVIKKKVWDIMLNGGNVNIKSLMGSRVYPTLENQYFRYCPSCIVNDYERYGETYWRLNHQIPGVFICEKHETYLLNSSVVCKYTNSQYLEAASIENCPITKECVNFSDKTKNHLKQIAQESFFLANEEYEFEDLYQIYRSLLMQKGYIDNNGLINRYILYRDFLEFYGEELLVLMNSTIEDSDRCWLIKMIRTYYNSFHPIRHLLLVIFLGKSVKQLPKHNKKLITPFGEGPYICLNKAAEHYGESVIRSMKIKKFKGQIKGIFECECGFSYSKLVPDHIGDEKDYWKIERYGNVWINKVYEYKYVKKLSVPEISRRLDVSVGKIYYCLKLDVHYEEKQEELKQLNRKKYLKLKEKHPDFLISHFKKVNQNLINWLYKHDRDWLMKNKPNIKRKHNNVYREVNWLEKDQEYLNRVKKIADDLYGLEPPVRVTKNRVAKELGLKGFSGYEEKTPITLGYLNDRAEDIEAFRLRRIKFVIKKLLEGGEVLSKTKIKERANVPKLYFVNKDLQEELNGLKEKYSL